MTSISRPRNLSRPQRAKSGEIELAVCTHGLAEVYAALTALPVRPRIGPAMARHLIGENVEATSTIVDLGVSDYRAVLDNQSTLGLPGGSVNDALAAQAARKTNSDKLVTLNEADFRRVWPDAGDRITQP